MVVSDRRMYCISIGKKKIKSSSRSVRRKNTEFKIHCIHSKKLSELSIQKKKLQCKVSQSNHYEAFMSIRITYTIF